MLWVWFVTCECTSLQLYKASVVNLVTLRESKVIYFPFVCKSLFIFSSSMMMMMTILVLTVLTRFLLFLYYCLKLVWIFMATISYVMIKNPYSASEIFISAVVLCILCSYIFLKLCNKFKVTSSI